MRLNGEQTDVSSFLFPLERRLRYKFSKQINKISNDAHFYDMEGRIFLHKLHGSYMSEYLDYSLRSTSK